VLSRVSGIWFFVARLAVILLLSGFCSLAWTEQLVTVVFQDSYPKYYLEETPEGPRMTGLGVDILRLLEQELGDVRFEGRPGFVPIKRIYRGLESGEFDLYLGAGKTLEREQRVVFSRSPLYRLKFMVACRRDFPIDLEAIQVPKDLAEQGELVALFGTASERRLARKLGLAPRESSHTLARNLRLVAFGRADFAYYHDLGLVNTINREGLSERLQLLPLVFEESHHYVAFSPNLAPELRERIDEAVKRLYEDGAFRRLLKAYLRPEMMSEIMPEEPLRFLEGS